MSSIFDARLLKTIPGSQSLTVFGNPFHKGTVSVAEEVGFKRLPANTQGLFQYLIDKHFCLFLPVIPVSLTSML